MRARTHLGLGKDAPLTTSRPAIWDHRCHANLCPACIIDTRGYDFREGQGYVALELRLPRQLSKEFARRPIRSSSNCLVPKCLAAKSANLF